MRHRLSLLLCTSALLAAGYIVVHVVGMPKESHQRDLSIKIIRRWTDSGLPKLLWAGGPVIVRGGGRRIERLNRDGRVVSVRKSPWLIVGTESVQCDDPVIIGEFMTRPYSPTDPDSRRAFGGLIDLRTGEQKKLWPSGKASLFLNAYLYGSQFWSPDYETYLVYPPIRTHRSAKGYWIAKRQLALVHPSSSGIRLWTPSDGGYPRSWVWSDGRNREKGFWILASHPGRLYHLGGKEEHRLTIHALDNAPTTMLSPGLDRAVAFAETCSEGFLVNFSKPGSRLPIAISGSDNIRGLTLGWGAWSPNGRRVALLLADRTKAEGFQLYIGDPARTLKRVSHKDLRVSLPVRGWDGDMPGLGSLVWSTDSRSVYCRMIEAAGASGHVLHYVLVRVDVPERG